MARLLFAILACAGCAAGAAADTPGRLLVERVPAQFPAPATARPGAAQLAAPWVRRQNEVVAEARVADVVIETSALALADGREGDVIQVRLSGGGPIRQGRVIAPGRVAL